MSSNRSSQSIVRLYLSGQGYFQGIVTSMSTSGIMVDFADDKRPDVPPGAAVELALSSDRLHSSLRLPARAAGHEEDAVSRRYSFAIDLEAQAALRALIDARNECRITPNVETPILVMLRQPGGEVYVEGGLDDVSRTGLSVFVRKEDGDTIRQEELTRISFLLPGEKAPIQLCGFLRHTKDEEEQVRLGFEFTPGANEENARDVERYHAYVEALKDELLAHLRACRSELDAA